MTKEDKYEALNEAIAIAKEHAKGGSEKITPGYALQEAYKIITKMMMEIEQED